MDASCEIVCYLPLFFWSGATILYSIILDEIHTIGQQEGGSVWEQILLLAPCPIMLVLVLSSSTFINHDPPNVVQWSFRNGGYSREVQHVA